MTNIMFNGTKHLACVVLVDSSGSMSGDPIRELNDGLRIFGESLNEDSYAKGVVDICVINFNTNVETIVPFSPAANYIAPHLNANGCTSLNTAIIAGLEALEQREAEYNRLGVDYWKSWMFLMTDGIPTDIEKESEAYQKLRGVLEKNRLTFFPMAIGQDANVEKLRSYTKDGAGAVFKARKEYFKDAFVWLSRSLTSIGNSLSSTKKVALPPVPDGIVVDLSRSLTSIGNSLSSTKIVALPPVPDGIVVDA